MLRVRVQNAEAGLAATVETLRREAESLHRQRRVAEAINAYQQLLEREPALADCWFNLAILQRETRQLNAALGSYRRALVAGIARPWEVHVNCAVIYTDYLHEHTLAEAELRQALSLKPGYVPALLNLANLCEDLGRREEARVHYVRVLTIDPRCYEALARYANVQAPSAADAGMVRQLREALADRTCSAFEQASVGFALGRLLDAAGDYPAAFKAYGEANRASRASVGPSYPAYDRQWQHALVDRLIELDCRSASTPPASAASVAVLPAPIFICGMFRSGSTLIEQLLANCPGVHSGGELEFLPRLVAGELAPFPESLARLQPERSTALAARYVAEITRLGPGATHFIDKRPDNFLYIGLIKRLFPAARIVHTTRDPLDNCLSIYFLHLDQRLNYALDPMDIGHYYREYRRLMAHWKSRYGADIHDVDYDTLVRDPLPVLNRLCSFLGLDWGDREPQVPPSGRAIKTASVWQAREPLYRNSSGRAGHYRAQLGDLRSYLSDLLPVAAEEG